MNCKRMTTAAASIALCCAVFAQQAAAKSPEKPNVSNASIYDFTVKDIDGKDVDLSKYKDFVLLVVNVASQ